MKSLHGGHLINEKIKNWWPIVKSDNDNEIMKRTVGTSALRSRRQLSSFPPELCRQTPWFQDQGWYVCDQRFRGRNKSQQQPMHCHQMLKSQPTTLSSRRRSCCPASQFTLRTTERLFLPNQGTSAIQIALSLYYLMTTHKKTINAITLWTTSN